ncbi:glycosyltransferase family 2 protein [Polynucleobacter sp. AP-Kaivos-20-H2]|uniref:glycosyltransferase family 2 protein n=1 Tax=Polynucleobacter sp. AP-Kaivos-20-H2 TaxID=2689104 RepID=UPI001C0BE2F2|nr:glycosyltransferase family 2 protein [Polynucleobacter sp. AP-Kaivos-20-H2]MBU3604100.1 glycosyltransferase [Polynucleobacter sp. AP-Kaivos-20-H2]
MSPKVSIITVCFNSAKTIGDTIESVLSQDYPDIEYIVIDGGSSDETVSIVNEYSDRISTIVSERDRGIYDAMNKGIAHATGDIVGMLNSDDVYINKHAVSDLIREMQKKNTDSVYADLVIVDPLDLNKVMRYYDSSYFTPNKFRFGWMPAHPTFFVKKALYDKVGPYSLDYKISADYEMLIRLLWVEKASYSYLKEPMVRMRHGGASTAGLSRVILLNKEIVLACRKHHINTNLLLLMLKIPTKLLGLIFKKSEAN